MNIKNIETSVIEMLRSAFNQEGLPAVSLQPAPEHVDADISVPWPMSAAKILRKAPLEIAKAAAEKLKNIDGIASVTAAPPGFINIKLSDKTLAGELKELAFNCDKHIRLERPPQEKILIEFVSANPTGPLHVASGRGASLGDSLVRIWKALGYTVSAEYYVNDAGNQAQLLGVSLKARKEGKEPPENGYHGDYVKELAKEVPDNISSEEDFSKFGIEKLLSTHKRDMKEFRVNFDVWFRESSLYDQKLIPQTLEHLKKLGKTYDKDNAVWFGTTTEAKGEDDKDRVLIRQDGRPTYFLSDIAYHRNKYERGFNRLIDIWGADHHGYVPRMKTAVAALGYPPDSFHVIIHQLIHLNKGGEAVKMSKRAGEFITLKELVDDVGADACRFFFASRTPNSHLNFDIDLAKKRSQENPVFYVQYVHARICSIFRTAKEKNIDFSSADINTLCPQERAMISKLIWLQQTLKTCAAELSPHHLTVYLTETAGLFHKFYDACRVLDDSNPELTKARLLICLGIKNAIAKSLDLLGVSAPEEM